MTEMFGEAWSPMSVPDLAPDDDDDDDIKEITDVTGVLVEATAAIESPRVRVHWYLTQDKCMFQGPAGEVASFTEEFIHSLPNLQLFSNERNLPKQIISMDIEEDSTTNIYSLSRQVSV